MDIRQRALSKVLVIGETCEDIFVYGHCDRISPEAPIPVLDVYARSSSPGMAANVAKNLTGLGCNVVLLSNDEKLVKTRFVDARHNQHMLRVDSQSSLKEFDETLLQNFEEHDFNAIVISDYNKGFLTSQKLESLVPAIQHKFKCKVFVDSKKQNLSCFVDCVIKINEKEFSISRETIHNTSTVIKTLGEDGAEYDNKIFPVKKVDVFDVGGAGDTFLAGLVKKFLETNDIYKSIEYANLCASFVVTKHGTYAIKLEDIENEICV